MMDTKSRYDIKDNFWRYYFCLLIIAALFYLFLISSPYVWCDEAFTYGVIRSPLRDIWNIAASDVHPPLYYYILKILTFPFHYNLAAGKIVTFIPFLGILSLGGFQLRQMLSEKVALTFMVVFLLYPYTLIYSVEIRMYSYSAFFVFAAALYGHKIYRDEQIRDVLLYILFGICAAYTHYYALLSFCVIHVILLLTLIIKKRKKSAKWFLTSLVLLVLYIPWLTKLFSQVSKASGGYWIEPITLRTLATYIYHLFGVDGIPPFCIVMSLCVLYLIYSLLITEDKRIKTIALVSIAVPLFTFLVAMAASILIRPLFVLRYIVPAVPLLVLFLVLSFSSVKDKRIKSIIILIFFVCGISNYCLRAYEEHKIRKDELDAAFISKYIDCDAFITQTTSDHTYQVLSYYLYDYGKVPVNSMGDYSSAMLFLDVGATPDESILLQYDSQDLGLLHENYNELEAFLLRKKVC